MSKRINERLIALTFDDGPSEWTERLLLTLKAHNARATFFVVGLSVKEWPDVVRKAADAGHHIGNHTFTHPNLLSPEVDDNRLREELWETSETIADVIGERPTMFRPPHTRCDDRVLDEAGRIGLEWTFAGHVGFPDWNISKPARILKQIMRRARSGAIIDLHDGRAPGDVLGSPTREPTIKAVADALNYLSEDFDFVTVPELLDAAGV